MTPIYYVYEKDTGLFAGSGITEFDDADFGSTTVPCPSCDFDAGERACWDGSEWKVV